VRIAPSELQQVLVNLLVNAIHAMPDGGRLGIETADWADRGATVTVRDTGAGIREDDLPRVFDPFFTTKKREGTGLGLSVSHTLVERYGGRITVESRPGEGAAFTVWLLAEPTCATRPRRSRRAPRDPLGGADSALSGVKCNRPSAV